MSKYPQDLIITIDDFKKSSWQEVIKGVGEHRYSDYWSAYSKAADIAIKAGEVAKGKVLWLFADATSMMLKPASLGEPFQPIAIIDGRRSIIASDFSIDDLMFFETVLPEISDFVLKARLSDILWVVKKPKNFQHALIAIDAYKSFPLDSDKLVGEVENAWERGIRLARILGEGTFGKLEEIRNTLFVTFQAANFDQKFYLIRLADLLEISLIDKDKIKDIASKLENFAQRAKHVQDWYCARAYIERAINWHKRNNDHAACYRLIVEKAETWVTESEQRKEAMVSGSCLESAIKAYREIPGKERDQFKVNERMAELHKLMNNANRLSLDEMKEISTPEIDITQSVEASRKHVSGRNFPEVLVAFANIYPGAKVDDIEKGAKENMQDSIIHLLCTSVHMTQDGRVAARSAGINPNDSESSETKVALWQTMMRNYGLNVGLVVQAHILPALRVINREHTLTERILNSLCGNSHIIPIGREIMWAKGLFYGFENDFAASIHLLAPQVEHLVRTLMKQKGIKTTTLNSQGIETENGLSALLEDSNIEKVIDKDLLFEFKGLLTEPTGPNLRNEIAHGLLEFKDTRSPYAIYLWWFCLRLVVRTIPWKSKSSESQESPS